MSPFFAYGWWQRDRYATERLPVNVDDDQTSFAARNDSLLELGGGLLWHFAKDWEAGPNIIYLRDRSNDDAFQYCSIELFFTVRRDF